MGRRLLAHFPVATVPNNLATNPITTAAWATLSASLPKAAAAIEVFNPSGSSITLAIGAAGFEVPLPYTVLPGGSAILLPFELPKGSRLSAKAIDSNATTGYFTINLFG